MENNIKIKKIRKNKKNKKIKKVKNRRIEFIYRNQSFYCMLHHK